MKPTTWIKEHVDTPEHARTAIAVVTSVGGAIGFLLAILGALMAR
jgi:hypothetical protein